MSSGENFDLLRAKTASRLREIAEGSRGIMGVSVIDLQSGEIFGVNENLRFPQASAIKIPILMEAYKQANDGKFTLAESRAIEKDDKTPGSGVLKELGDGTAHLSIKDLCILMIVLSDNTATNMIIDLLGMENINRTMEGLGLKETRVRRRMMDTAALARGDENLSTPVEASRIMEILFRNEFISREVSSEILSILIKPKTGSITAGVPENVPIAFKSGAIAGVSTEWAIVMLKERPYVVAVMENYGVETDGVEAMKEISRVLYRYFSRLGRSSPYGAYVPPASSN